MAVAIELDLLTRLCRLEIKSIHKVRAFLRKSHHDDHHGGGGQMSRCSSDRFPIIYSIPQSSSVMYRAIYYDAYHTTPPQSVWISPKVIMDRDMIVQNRCVHGHTYQFGGAASYRRRHFCSIVAILQYLSWQRLFSAHFIFSNNGQNYLPMTSPWNATTITTLTRNTDIICTLKRKKNKLPTLTVHSWKNLHSIITTCWEYST